jgi:hypothetical protein
LFARGSRYQSVPDAVHVDGAGREIAYKRLRIIPTARGVITHAVVREDRLDLIAHRYFGDPEQFWRIVDANDGMMPPALLTELGRRLVIPLVAGG